MAALIAHKVNLNDNAPARSGDLSRAAAGNHFSTVKLLGDAGANPNLPVHARNADSILGCAASSNNLDMIDYLLNLKVDVNDPGNDSGTPLIAAAYWNHPDAIVKLLDHGANLNLKNNFGRTALMSACVCENAQCVQALIDRNPDLNLTDSQGETALTIAGDRGEVGIESREMLKKQGPNEPTSTL